MMLPDPRNDLDGQHWQAWVNASGTSAAMQAVTLVENVSYAEAEAAFHRYWQARNIRVSDNGGQWVFVDGAGGEYIAGNIHSDTRRFWAQQDCLKNHAVELFQALLAVSPNHPLIVTLNAALAEIAQQE